MVPVETRGERDVTLHPRGSRSSLSSSVNTRTQCQVFTAASHNVTKVKDVPPAARNGFRSLSCIFDKRVHLVLGPLPRDIALWLRTSHSPLLGTFPKMPALLSVARTLKAGLASFLG